MLKKFRLTIEYDGTDYHGWQRQKDLPTIQEAIEEALKRMTHQSPSVVASGRTDSGVHALDQVAHFSIQTEMAPDVLKRGINSLTPSDIVIKECRAVADSFHARFGALSKVYDYYIYNHPTPTALYRRYTWHIKRRLDLTAMREGAAFLLGTHDFSAFEATGSERTHAVRTILGATVTSRESGRFVIVSIEGSGFLRCMVRNLVGTLADVGRGKTSPENFRHVLESRDRAQAGATAPSRGLFLRTVRYDDDKRAGSAAPSYPIPLPPAE